MTATEDKLRAILDLEFPVTLAQLDTYIGLSGWLRNYVPYYSAIIQPLQDRKTWLLNRGPSRGKARRFYTERTPLDDVTDKERESFKSIQDHVKLRIMLIHQNTELLLYADTDSSKERGHGAMVFHVKYDIHDDPLYNAT
jgi:hypothetical protein